MDWCYFVVIGICRRYACVVDFRVDGLKNGGVLLYNAGKWH